MSAAATKASLDALTAEIDRLRAADTEWGRLHQQVIEERAAALQEVATLKRTRDDLHEANNRYQQEARDARAALAQAERSIEVTDDAVRQAGNILMRHGLNAPEQVVYQAARAVVEAALQSRSAPREKE